MVECLPDINESLGSVTSTEGRQATVASVNKTKGMWTRDLKTSHDIYIIYISEITLILIIMVIVLFIFNLHFVSVYSVLEYQYEKS